MKSEGILLVDKPKNKSSFYLVTLLRAITNIRKIGHCGTLDPLATGLMIMLIGKNFTRLSDTFIGQDKDYEVSILFGTSTATYDTDGDIIKSSKLIPTDNDVKKAVESFQGKIMQIPPMFSAKKIGGKKLYTLAREGKEVDRQPKEVEVKTTLISYNYPYLNLHITCSSGTYIRTIANDIGELLTCCGCVAKLTRLRVGSFHLDKCVSIDQITDLSFNYTNHLIYENF